MRIASGISILNRVIREVLKEKATSERRPERDRGFGGRER